MSPRRTTRAGSRAALASIGVGPSGLRAGDAIREALTSVTRSPTRTLLTALGTILGVGAMLTIVGLSATASGAVGDTFDVLRATEVTFSDHQPTDPAPALTVAGEQALIRLHGVASAGLTWTAMDGQPQRVRRALNQDSRTARSVPVAVASARALATIGVQIAQGRTYDSGMENRHVRVGLLGSAAARDLGITRVDRAPVVYLGQTAVTIIGIIADTEFDAETLTSLVLPTTIATDLGLTGDRKIITRTAPGAAQLIAAQGPYALYPTDPGRIVPLAPPDPTLLRNQVQGSITTLLIALALVALTIGIIAITNTTLLAVIQRRSEIGLRRAMGAAPRHIAALILTEAAVIGTIGGIIGTSVAVVAVAAVAAVKGWEPVLDPLLALVTPLTGTAAGILAGAYPALKATRVSPLEALQR